MSDRRTPDVVFSFPELSRADAAVIAQELERELLRSGVSREEISIARSDKEAMDLGGLLLLFGGQMLGGAAQQLGKQSFDWLTKKYKVYIVAKGANGQSWTYGAEYRKGTQATMGGGAGLGALGVILLGASEFPGMQGLDNPAFAKSADLIRRTVTPEYSLFTATRELNLFDASLMPLDAIERIETFIDANPDINDYLIYYCGHGSYLRDRDRSYFLTLKSTKAGKEAFTGLKLQDLRLNLENRLVSKRLYLVLDCCFSGEAAREFMSDGSQEFMRHQIEEALPSSGWAVVTASSRSMVAMAPEGFDTAMFTGAFAEALRTGSPLFKTHFSLADLTDETRRRIIQTHGRDRAVAPLCVAAAQKDGDLTRVPLFINKAFDGAPKAAAPDDMAKFEAIAHEYASEFIPSRRAALENAYALWQRSAQPEVKNRISSLLNAAAEKDDSLSIRELAEQYRLLMDEPMGDRLERRATKNAPSATDRKAEEIPEPSNRAQAFGLVSPILSRSWLS